MIALAHDTKHNVEASKDHEAGFVLEEKKAHSVVVLFTLHLAFSGQRVKGRKAETGNSFLSLLLIIPNTMSTAIRSACLAVAESWPKDSL
jgi:hypothetical protein